jgi:hypothetical protein
MGDWSHQPLPPGISDLTVQAEVVSGRDEVTLSRDGASPFLLRLTGNQAKALAEALYLAGAETTWAAWRRAVEEREG